MTTLPTTLGLSKKKAPLLLEWAMGISTCRQSQGWVILERQHDEPVSLTPWGQVCCGGCTQLHVSLQGAPLMADWHAFPEFLCRPRGTCHIGNNVSKLRSCQGSSAQSSCQNAWTTAHSAKGATASSSRYTWPLAAGLLQPEPGTHPSGPPQQTQLALDRMEHRVRGTTWLPPVCKTFEFCSPLLGGSPESQGRACTSSDVSLQSLSSDTSEPTPTTLFISKWARDSPLLVSTAQHLPTGRRLRASPKKVLLSATSQPCSFSKKSSDPG